MIGPVEFIVEVDGLLLTPDQVVVVSWTYNNGQGESVPLECT